MSEENQIQGTVTIDEVIAKTAKSGEIVLKLSEEVAIRLHERAGWHVMDVMTLTKDLKNSKGKDIGGLLVEAPISEPQLNNLIQVLQARRIRR